MCAKARPWAARRDVVRRRFRDAYRQTAAGSPLVPAEEAIFDRVLAAFELEKAVYELEYEMNNRPGWSWIPVAGIQAILARTA